MISQNGFYQVGELIAGGLQVGDYLHLLGEDTVVQVAGINGAAALTTDCRLLPCNALASVQNRHIEPEEFVPPCQRDWDNGHVACPLVKAKSG